MTFVFRVGEIFYHLNRKILRVPMMRHAYLSLLRTESFKLQNKSKQIENQRLVVTRNKISRFDIVGHDIFTRSDNKVRGLADVFTWSSYQLGKQSTKAFTS